MFVDLRPGLITNIQSICSSCSLFNPGHCSKSLFGFFRYQPEQPSLVFETQEEGEMSDGISVPSMGILPGVEERFSVKSLLMPYSPEPSLMSGSVVNVCTSIMGKFCAQD